MSEDKASNPHPAYAGLETKRDVYRAVYGGTDSIRKTSTANLPKYPAESDPEYQVRLGCATIDGLVLGGVEQLCGSVFEGEIDTEKVHATLKPYLENVDNKGNHFNIFAREAFRASFEGFSLILVDMPTATATDLADQKKKGLRPYLNLYPASSVINWRYRVNPVSKQKELTLLVLMEVSSEAVDRFSVADVTRYRVFEVNNSVVTWELWKETGEGKDKQLVKEDDGMIEKITAIPAAFIGDVMDDPKLLVESRLEIKAYQKESSFDAIEYLQMPTFVTKGYEGEETLKLGASAHLKLPADPAADAFYMQMDAAGHDSLKKSIAEIKDHIKARVNYLITSASEKTATQANIEDRDKQARLIVWADELKDALERALQFMGQFVGLGEDQAGEIVLVTSWSNAKLVMTAEDVTAESNLVTEGLESLETFVEKRYAAGLLPEGVDVKTELERIDKEMEKNAGIKPVVEAGKMPNEGQVNADETNKTEPEAIAT